MGIRFQDNSFASGRRSGYDRRANADPRYTGIERRITQDRRKRLQKRKFPRFRAKDLTFVKLSSESDVDVGQLLDISGGGLALRYFMNTEKKKSYSNLGIFISGGTVVLDQVYFRPVSDIEITNSPPFSQIVLRRYGVEFEKLTSEQEIKLDEFITNHTFGEA